MTTCAGSATCSAPRFAISPIPASRPASRSKRLNRVREKSFAAHSRESGNPALFSERLGPAFAGTSGVRLTPRADNRDDQPDQRSAAAVINPLALVDHEA